MEQQNRQPSGRGNRNPGQLSIAAGLGGVTADPVPDLLETDLKILFIGINPGLRSGETGNHFAGRSTRFWRFLYESGLTPVKYQAEDCRQLLNLGYGITNIVSRATANAAELKPAELRQGAERLRVVLREQRPKIAAYLGKVVYQYVAGRSQFTWGIQPQPVVEGIIDFVMPNPSGLNRMPFPEQLQWYRQLQGLVKACCGE